MAKYLKISNLILVILIIFLIYLGYDQFIREQSLVNKLVSSEENSEKDKPASKEKKDKSQAEKKNSPEKNSQPSSDSNQAEEETVNTPTPKIRQPDKVPENVKKEQNEPEPTKGFYENSTYNYKVDFPKGWPLRIRSKENVSLGYVIPENGLGAVTIEVSEEVGNEVEEAKQEAQKYSGMVSIKEQSIVLAGKAGTKYIMEENMSGEKDIYILLEKPEYSYLIKYTERAEEINTEKFLPQVNYILDSFEFINS